MAQINKGSLSPVSRRSPLLLEIGSEEIPARFVVRGLAIFKENVLHLLNSESIAYGKISEYATPRRLTVHIEDVSEIQNDRTIETLGPPKKVSFDENGMPTKAAIGFARSIGIDVKDLKVVQTDRGEYVSATVEQKGKASKDVLSNGLPSLISSLQLPKTMRWGSGSLRFFRPIRWILALIGHETIEFEIDGIKSGSITYGHRFLSAGAVRISDPSEYLPALRQNHVIADSVERKNIISGEIQKLGSALGIHVHEDNELLDTVMFLVEYPTIVSGSFENKYIDLPKELLITVMRTHQKYFSTESAQGTILPSFIVVSNTKSENSDTVRRGAERVLRARLEDARFYFAEDQKIPLHDYTEKLKSVTFQEKLGTLHDKANRISSICSFIADRLNFPAKEKLLRAATLAKADLVTGIVREFPELQGYMGMIYALNSGEDKEIAHAIYEHYQPRFAGDKLPDGEMGTILSLADKIDNIVSFYSLGLIPSGSEDPFALRRQATGIINILQNSAYPLTVNMLIDRALEISQASHSEKPAVAEKIVQFFNQRIEGVLLSQGYSYDLVDAAIAVEGLSMNDLKSRIEALDALKRDPAFPGLLMAAKRVCNIISRMQPSSVNKDIFTEDAEKKLYLAGENVRTQVQRKDYRAIFELEKPINTFFDSVLVMDKDDEVKNNRIALLFSVKEIFDCLGDFSRIAE
ncbi:MAG: glycine--tRNA ligase subunit beta [Nitrospiraceae bacterium]|nr:MAG: glycine--tRNA ligase subunit beta [Nitrospiraceae bacterium]